MIDENSLEQTDSFNKLSENEQAFDENYALSLKRAVEIIQAFYEYMGNIAETIGQTIEWINGITKSESFRQTIIGIRNIIEYISSIKWVDYSLGTEEAIKRFMYISLAQKAKWPIFHIDDITLRTSVLAVHSDDSDEIRTIVLDYFNKERIFQIGDIWERSEAINTERKPLLKEAITLHCNHYYYASTSILMCQVYGIAQDIRLVAKNGNLVINEEKKDAISELYRIKRDRIDGEKGRIIQMFSFIEEDVLMWSAALEYMIEEVLCSSGSAD